MENVENLVSPEEVSEEILTIVRNSSSASQNNGSILINWDMLPFKQRYRFDIRKYINDTIKEEAKRKGFMYCEELSDRDKLIFR